MVVVAAVAVMVALTVVMMVMVEQEAKLSSYLVFARAPEDWDVQDAAVVEAAVE